MNEIYQEIANKLLEADPDLILVPQRNYDDNDIIISYLFKLENMIDMPTTYLGLLRVGGDFIILIGPEIKEPHYKWIIIPFEDPDFFRVVKEIFKKWANYARELDGRTNCT